MLVLFLALAGCSGKPSEPLPTASWQAADLRGLEKPGLPNPDFDLIAAYARQTATDLELRFDLLGSPDPSGYDVYLALDTTPGEGSSQVLDFISMPGWDLLLHFPARGLPRAISADGRPAAVRPRILRDGLLDSLTVRISRSSLPANLQQVSFQAFLTRPGETVVADMIGPYPLSGAPPSGQAQVFVVFWDALPAATPAQALRRWDGAHTGPYGQRHGLSVLLRASSSAGVPVAVLDLKEAARLSALDALGGLSFIRDLQRQNLLLLPDLAHGDPSTAQDSLTSNSQAATRFGLAWSPYFAGPLDRLPQAGYQVAFAYLDDPEHIGSWNGARIIPLPKRQQSEAEQVGREGLSVETRKRLLQAALSPDPADLIVLGGSLPSSPWGDSLIAGPAFAFLSGHPWIKVLDGADLLKIPAAENAPECPDYLCRLVSLPSGPVEQAREALAEAEHNLFSQLAWQTFLSLTDPTADDRLAALRANYIGYTGILLAAADWYQTPGVQASCDVDLDWDGEPECVLASEEIFLVFERQGARLVLAASRSGGEPLQWIGPRSQFIVGLGDPIEWQPEAGQAADPQEISGAFAWPLDNDVDYQANLQPGLAEFTHPTQEMRKIFRLDTQRLQVTVESSQPVHTQVPLTLLTGDAFTPDWYARFGADKQNDSTSLNWKLSDGPAINLSAETAQLAMDAFTDSLPVLGTSEDPDFSYLPGHYVPFPMAVVEIQSQGSFILEFSIQD